MLAFVSIQRVLNSKMLSFATLSDAPKSSVSHFVTDWLFTLLNQNKRK
ncbi:TPA: hypothetical protein ACGOYV_001566 [Streptococcus suis]